MIKNKPGFTLIELIIVVAVIAILAAIVVVATKPLQRFRETNNAVRRAEIDGIAKAVKKYQVDYQGVSPIGLDTTLRMIGESTADDCSVECGSTSEITYHNTSESLNYYSNNTYTVRHWFDVSGVSNFSSLVVSIVLDCDNGCSGEVRVRIGNTSSYSDYDFVNAALVRTDGTTGNYSWYTNTYSINKSTLGDYFFVQILKYTGSGTIKFIMDESGPTGPDPEYSLNDSGPWNNDNGDYFIKIGVPGQTADACLDLGDSLVDSYFAKMPVDPKDGSDDKTHYAIKETASGAVQVVACHAEDNEEIQIIR